MGRERIPKRLGESVGGVLSSLDSGGWGYAKARAVAAWERVAGEQIGAHTTGAFLREGELVIYVDSPVWAHELQAMSEHFRQAIAKEIGQESVKALRFVVSKDVARDIARRQAEEADEEAEDPGLSLVELPQGEKDRLAQESEGIDDKGLREAFLRARMAAERRKRST